MTMSKSCGNVAGGTLSGVALAVAASGAGAQPKKNWTAPAHKMHGQQLCDETMAKHPELISVTLHGVPPGLEKVYTMFAGSYPDRIGNADDPDDVMIIETGITILDPRWHRPKDPIKKYVMMVPLRDAAGENIGLLVLAYHHEANSTKTDLDYLKASTILRDPLQKQIPSYGALNKPAK